MERIFLSFHYDQAGKDLAGMVSDLIVNHGLVPVTGERVDGNLSNDIRDLIETSDALICLLTEREAEQNRQWLMTERDIAYGQRKPILTLVQKGSQDPGVFEGHKEIRYDPEAPLPGILELSGILGEWRKRGRFVTALLLPSDIAYQHAHAEASQIQYRCWTRDQTTDWEKAVTKKIGQKQTVAYLPKVPEGAEIEVRLAHNGTVWESGSRPQYLNVTLEKVE